MDRIYPVGDMTEISKQISPTFTWMPRRHSVKHLTARSRLNSPNPEDVVKGVVTKLRLPPCIVVNFTSRMVYTFAYEQHSNWLLNLKNKMAIDAIPQLCFVSERMNRIGQPSTLNDR